MHKICVIHRRTHTTDAFFFGVGADLSILPWAYRYYVYVYTRTHAHTHTHTIYTGWQRAIGCLIFMFQFLPNSL